MPAPRIAAAEAPYESLIAEHFSRIMPTGMEPLKLFRTMARNPRVLQRMFAGALLDRGSIDMRDREIVILRTCARCGSEYEWGVHVTLFSQRAGLTKAEIAATLDSESFGAVWSASEMSLIKLADALHDQSSVPDAAWNDLVQHYTEQQVLELIALIGYYHTISFMTNAACVELESYAARFAQYAN